MIFYYSHVFTILQSSSIVFSLAMKTILELKSKKENSSNLDYLMLESKLTFIWKFYGFIIYLYLEI